MNQNTEPDISIIIVNYNSSDLLADCVNSIINNIHEKHEIIVFDNASSDDSIIKTQKKIGNDNRLKIFISKENLGFAKANNIAVKSAKGKYLHFLNPDTVIDSSLNEEYENLVKKRSKALSVTGIRESDGKNHKMKHLIPTLGNFYNVAFCKQKARYWNIGASIITDIETFNLIGGWPENYFMYAEDLDFFYLAQKKNIPVEYLKSSVTHIGKGSTSSVWTNLERSVLIEKSTRKFYKKYGLYYQYFIIRPIQLVFILFKEPGMFSLTLKAILKSFFK